MGIIEPIISTYYQMVLGELIGEGVRRHHWYFKERATCLIMAAKRGTKQEADSKFNDMKRRVKKPSQKEINMIAPWISDVTW